MSLLPNLGLSILMVFIFLYDVITLPIFFLISRPWKKTKAYKHVRSHRVATGDGEMTFRGNDRPSSYCEDILKQSPQIKTLDRAFDYAFHKHQNRRCLGTRKIIREESEKTPEGKTMKKLVLGDYSWQTYAHVKLRSEAFGIGLRNLGLQQREKLVIYADTRAGWLIAAIGCFKYNFPLVTIYTNLGESGVQYGISQTQAEYVLVSQELLPKLFNVLKDLQHINTIVVFEEPHKGPLPSAPDDFNGRIVPFEEVINTGLTTQVPLTPPEPEDTAIIMYTSGSTGNPKGVVLTHWNLINSLLSLIHVATYAVGTVREDDVHIAFLPLAHVLELLAENAYIIIGVAIGYSSPYTLTDESLFVKKGQKGDATVLKPTLMCAVPVILDRIYKGINKKVEARGEFMAKLVNFLIQYKEKWVKRGYSTPIANKLVFNKFKVAVGGRLRMLLSGGAPLADEAHAFIRTCLCVQVHQGYGLTETAAVACVSDESDISTGRVGPPLYGVDIKLVNWDEGGYRITDTVGPRGEIHVGGFHVAKGYYNMPEQTMQEFYDDDGKRWFKTGDIGQCMPDGTFKIVDRKKDLVKLQMGEYVSLGKVESTLKLHETIESICVCARSTERTSVAIIVPDQVQLEKIGQKLNKRSLSRSDLCKDLDVTRDLLKTLTAYGAAMKLERFEIPKAITLVEESWTPETGLVTAAMKLKRPALESFYKSDIDFMYSCVNQEYVPKPVISSSNKIVPV